MGLQIIPLDWAAGKSNRFDLVVIDGYENVFSVLHREIGPRSRVWSEKEYVDQAAFEFSEVSVMYHNTYFILVCSS